MSTHNHPLEGLRSSLANAAFAVEERLLWRSGDGLKRVVDVARWPFERAAWALERAVIWPLEERTGDLSGALRTLGVFVVALAATALGVLALVWASDGRGDGVTRATAPAPASAVAQQPLRASEPGAPVLQGAPPDFTPEADAGVSEAKATATSGVTGVTSSTTSPSGSSTASGAEQLGPEALKVAREFAGAFVLYEIGADEKKVRPAFAATATPKLTHDLLQRPPRLPANVEVPKAKVLNIVPGPRHGDTYTLSVSLLRVGVTSELRIEMQYDKKHKSWRVTDARG
jgi:hypothetical protein